MFNFLKICGKGLLAILLSPFWLSAFLLTAVFGLVLFIFNSFRILVIDLHNLFAKKQSDIIDPLGDLPEDLEVLRIKKANEASLVQVVDPSKATATIVETASPTPTITATPTATIAQEPTAQPISSTTYEELPHESSEEPVENLEDKEVDEE